MDLYVFVMIISLVCVLGFFNEKLTKLNYGISLILLSTLIGLLAIGASVVFKNNTDTLSLLNNIQTLDIDESVMKGSLCFILFAASCHMDLASFKSQAKRLVILSLVCTLLCAGIFGGLFYGASILLGIGIPLPVCLLFGSIVASTDPIASAGIVSKFKFPKNISTLLRGEALFNSIVSAILFVCLTGVVNPGSSENAAAFILKEVLGAIVVGVVVTGICYILFRFTKNKNIAIFTGLMAVTISFVISEKFGFSSPIACLICGLTFSILRSLFTKFDNKGKITHFNSFWVTIDVFLNSIIYVILGLKFVHVLQIKNVVILALAAIVASLAARVISILLSSVLMGNVPDGYKRFSFIWLMTWSGLKGGIAAALAMSTKSFLPENTYNIVLGGTFAIVFFTMVIQGLTINPVYKRIRRSQASSK